MAVFKRHLLLLLLQCDETLRDMVTSIAKDPGNLNLKTQFLGASELNLFICINHSFVIFRSLMIFQLLIREKAVLCFFMSKD